ncbi:hypothetical protein ACQCX2_13315 [Propionibacteriaceae bacterium Y1700]|uniref:hypothetical protein n=1 Tax=Microlunatus sp. Y1700 TaxID=3418487 RepID=UPI003DA7967E
MPIVVLTTAAGAPGATTTALGLALTWSGPTLLVEADPAGSSIASGYFRGSVDHSYGLLNLALGRTQTDLAQAILDESRVLDEEADRRILLGLAEPAQASALTSWWEPIAEGLLQLDAAGYTVLIDAGRLTQGSYPMPLLGVADLVLVMCRGTLSSAVRTQPIAAALHDVLERTGRAEQLGLGVIGQSDYGPQEIAKALRLPLVLRLPEDPQNARVLSDGVNERKFSTSALAKAYRAASMELTSTVARRRQVVGLEDTPPPQPRQPAQADQPVAPAQPVRPAHQPSGPTHQPSGSAHQPSGPVHEQTPPRPGPQRMAEESGGPR